jgi:hypothetical protein
MNGQFLLVLLMLRSWLLEEAEEVVLNVQILMEPQVEAELEGSSAQFLQ